ncbi:MAG TPA: hypothetical protein VI911_02520 [Patescibacteria group bacterium]|nr:hypothetical protein [Patescibacteria group bacterium]
MDVNVILKTVLIWSLIGGIVTLIYMEFTDQFNGGIYYGYKNWKEVIPNKNKRLLFITLMGPATIICYTVVTFFQWLRR